jgi:pimeloyl-ACP methyl ester carboxylesterase
MVMSLPPALPIVILQIGPGEYLVLMRGTTSGEEEGSNWGSAAEAMFGGSSYQNSVVKALQDAGLPADAKLHFAGHSQGGMIAQNLAVDPRITDHFDVKSVTMFGSPDTLAKANPDVKYVSFEAPGDIVPKLDDAVVSMLPGQEWNPMAGHFRDVTRQGENHMIVNSPDAWNLDPNVSHSVYDNEGVLSGYKVPFEAKDWQNVSMSGSDVSTVGPKIYGGAKATVDFIGRRLKDMKVF